MARKIEVQILGDDSSLQRSFRSSSQASGRFGRSLANVGKAAALAAGGGILALGYGLKKSVDAALEAEKAETRLESAFKAVNVTAAQRVAAQEAVNKVSRSAALDDEALMDTLGRLTRVTGDVTEAQRGMAISANVARGRGLELEAATKIVEKAYLGNVGALKRIGIEIPKVTAAQDALKAAGGKVTEEQKKQAKATDDLATRQKAVAALQEQYAGASERFGQTASGAVERFQVAWENLQETLGARVLPFLTSALGSISGLLEAEGFRAKLTIVWEGLKEAATNLATALTNAVREIDWGPIGTAIGEGVSQALEAAKDTGAKLGKSLDQQINTVDWRGLGRRVGEEITGGVSEGMEQGKGGGGFFETIGRLTVTWYAALARFGLGLAESLSESVTRGLAALPGLIGQSLARAVQAGARAIQSAASNWDKWAMQAGLAVVRGVVAGLKALGGKIGQQLGQARAAIAGAGAGFFSEAYNIGVRIVNGIVSGVGGLAGRLKGAISGAIGSALSSIDIPGFSPPEHAARKAIGEPLAKGAIDGWIYGSRELPEKMSARVKAAIERGRQAVAAARDRFRSAFSDLASDALSAFDRVVAKMQTPAEKALADFDRRKQVEGMQRELSQAQAELATARAEGDNDKIVAAMQRVADAEVALWRDALEQQATQERAALDDRNELRRRHFEERLAALEASWAKEGVSATKAHKTLMSLLASFGVDWRKSGKAMGLALAEGIRESEKAVVAAAAAVVNAGRTGLPGAATAPRSFQASVAGAGVAPNVTVYVAGSVQAEQDLATTIRNTISSIGLRNDGTGL